MDVLKCLIFGCGYLGRRVASAWLSSGHRVFAVTRSEANADLLRQLGIEPILADVCEPSTLTGLPPVDILLHAIGFDRNSGRTQDEVTRGGLQNLLAATQGRYQRFIHISSTSVYGQSEGEWVDELSACNPLQPGGQLAIQAETLVRDAHRTRNPNSIILRLAGIYGPDRLLSRIETLKSGQPLSGRPDAWLNLIHVDDAARAIECCTSRAVASGVYNIVDDCPCTRGEYFHELSRLIGAPSPTFDIHQPARRGSGGLNKRCSNQRSRQELNWEPLFPSFETGLPASIQSEAT